MGPRGERVQIFVVGGNNGDLIKDFYILGQAIYIFDRGRRKDNKQQDQNAR